MIKLLKRKCTCCKPKIQPINRIIPGIKINKRKTFIEQLGHIVRSPLEKDGYLIIKDSGINYEHEKPFIIFDDNGKKRKYIADAVIGYNKNHIIEFKGHDFENTWKLDAVKKAYPNLIITVVTYDNDIVRNRIQRKTNASVICLSTLRLILN